MEAFQIELAQLPAQVHPLFYSTQVYCRRYATQRQPELVIRITEQALRFEQEMADREADTEGWKRRVFTGPFLERAAIQRAFAHALVQRNTLLLHGSTVAVDGQAYLFTASCGEGKSTHTRLWREVFGDRAVMVNDDKPFLKVTGEEIVAFGSPFSGKHGLDTNVAVPLKGICILHRDSQNRICPITPRDAMQMLQKQSYIPELPKLQEQAQALVTALAHRVPLWSMGCTKQADAARISYEAMSKGHRETVIPPL